MLQAVTRAAGTVRYPARAAQAARLAEERAGGAGRRYFRRRARPAAIDDQDLRAQALLAPALGLLGPAHGDFL